jgi:hypothetical protein
MDVSTASVNPTTAGVSRGAEAPLAGNDATPVFALAQPPTGTLFNEATYASSGTIAKLTGGGLATDTDTTTGLSPKAQAQAQATQPLLSR